MAAELRFILAALSALLLAGIWWWGARRSRQAAGNAELRESTMSAPVATGRTALPFDDDVDAAGPRAHDGQRDWGVSPLEPLSIRTASFEAVQLADLPMTAHADPLDETLDLGIADHGHQRHPDAGPAVSDESALPDQSAPPDQSALPDEGSVTWPREEPGAPAGEAQWGREETQEDIHAEAHGEIRGQAGSGRDEAPAELRVEPDGQPGRTSKPQTANVSETQRIVSIRVCATGQTRWSGVALMAALENHGLAHGRYNVFHRKHSDGRTLFCAASLVEPGVFNLAKMPQEEFRGLTLFAVLPGPLEPLQTLDALVETAGELAAALRGTLQDSLGAPLTMQRAEALREDIARFQAMLTMT